MNPKKTKNSQLRLRVFAGPNGSGKSTLIAEVKKFTNNGKHIDLGYYINADDISAALHKNSFSFKTYPVKASKETIIFFANKSGLLSHEFNSKILSDSFDLNNTDVRL